MDLRPLRPPEVATVAALLSAVSHACTWVGSDGETALGTVTLRPPRGIAIGRLTLLRYGALPFVAAQGLAAFRRLLWLKDTYDALEREAAGGAPHWCVDLMAVVRHRRTVTVPGAAPYDVWLMQRPGAAG
jgi:hypothetical protein